VQAEAQVQSLESELAALRSSLEEKTRSADELEQVCNELKDVGAQALDQIHSLDAEISELRAALDREKQQQAEARESLQAALLERDIALSSLQGAHEEAKSDLNSHRDNLVQVKQELAAVAGERALLNTRLSESLAQVSSLEDELHTVAGDQVESDKLVRSLTDELEQVRAALETERRQRHSVEEDLRNTALSGENAEEMIREARMEQERSRALLDSEREERRNAEERLRALEVASECRIQELSAELDGSSTRLHEFEEQVRLITREKLAAERQIVSLESEIDQARVALADEWDDHMTDNERFAAAQDRMRREEPGKPMSGQEPVAAETRSVVSRTSSLPMEMKEPSRSIMAVQDAPAEPETPQVTRFEDLFEDDIEGAEEPVVTIVCAPSVEVTMDAIACPPVLEIPEPDDEEPDETEEDVCAGDEDEDEDFSDETDEPVDDDEEPAPGANYRPVSSTPGISFDRAQWFDLLKWAHNSGVLSQNQRIQIVRMGRLIQKGRRLTSKQDEQVREMIALVHSLGYRFPGY
jgi:hypothetical protein